MTNDQDESGHYPLPYESHDETCTCDFCTGKKPQKYERPPWRQYFYNILNIIAQRASCDRGRAAALIVDPNANRIIATGYAGVPMGFPHCDEVGHKFEGRITHDPLVTEKDDLEGFLKDQISLGKYSNHCTRTVHAESNAICQAARYGIKIDGMIMYCKMTPCRDCVKLIIQSGISKIFSEYKYQQSEESEKMLEKANIYIIYEHDEEIKYGGSNK